MSHPQWIPCRQYSKSIDTPGVEMKCSWQSIRETALGKLYARKGSKQTQ